MRLLSATPSPSYRVGSGSSTAMVRVRAFVAAGSFVEEESGEISWDSVEDRIGSFWKRRCNPQAEPAPRTTARSSVLGNPSATVWCGS